MSDSGHMSDIVHLAVVCYHWHSGCCTLQQNFKMRFEREETLDIMDIPMAQVGFSSDRFIFYNTIRLLTHELLVYSLQNNLIPLNAISIPHHNLAGSQSDRFGGVSYFPTSWRARRTI
jgi:hypothetical protein